jgi:hypothetical protein
VLSGSIQVKQVDKVLEIGMSLTEWGSRGISTRRKMLKAGRVRPQSGTIEAHQLKIAVLAPISVLLHDSGTGFPSSKSRSNQRDPVTYGALHMKLQRPLLCLEKETHEEEPSHAGGEETEFKTKKTVHHKGRRADMWNSGDTVPGTVPKF